MKVNKTCKNKKCKKPLPEGYKHRYCEACRNQQAQKLKGVIKWGGGSALTLAALFSLKNKQDNN